ncbi:hypothetical protein [Spirillospora sp. NPDC047279]|uniref:hypothetical protein n=1 Tax=Spirillospora sp. NPDC047279 TaxID=3155478 RepID=UPI00340FE502
MHVVTAQHHGTHWRVAVLAAAALMAAAGPMTAVPAAATTPQTVAAAPTPRPAPTVTPAQAGTIKVADPRFGSAGGLVPSAVHPDVLWTFDSQASVPRLIALGLDGSPRALYTLQGLGRWTAMTTVRRGTGGGLLLGNLSKGQTGALTLYQVNEPARLASGTLPVKPYQLTYPDGGHDASTLLTDPADGRVYLVTRSATAAAVYALPAALGPASNQLTRLRRLPFGVRGGTFTPDGRVLLRTPSDIRVLAGIRQNAVQVYRAGQSAGDAIAATADGRRMIVPHRTKPAFWMFALAGARPQTPQSTATVPVADREDGPVSFPSDEGLPGGLIGTGALAGLVFVCLLGGLLYLRGRRRAAAAPAGGGAERASYSDYPDEPGQGAAYQDEPAAYPDERVAYREESAPYPDERVAYRDDSTPYPDDQVAYRDDRRTYGDQAAPYAEERGAYGDQAAPYADERTAYRDEAPAHTDVRAERDGYGSASLSGHDEIAYGVSDRDRGAGPDQDRDRRSAEARPAGHGRRRRHSHRRRG